MKKPIPRRHQTGSRFQPTKDVHACRIVRERQAWTSILPLVPRKPRVVADHYWLPVEIQACSASEWVSGVKTPWISTHSLALRARILIINRLLAQFVDCRKDFEWFSGQCPVLLFRFLAQFGEEGIDQSGLI